METIECSETGTLFSQVIARVVKGEEVIIERMGKPVAKISPYEEVKKKGLIGCMEGQMKVPDDFDEWPDDIAKMLGIKE